MNGFTLWVLLAATGQVGDVPQRDYGWQINKNDGVLEYIVQISPEKANYMIAQRKEFESSIPPDVAARVGRIIVSIGDEPIRSTPMSEVLLLPPVTKAVLANIESEAGRGRFSDLEAAPRGDVRNVAGSNAAPPLTQGNGLATNSPAASNFPGGPASGFADSSSMDNLLAQNSSTGFLNDTRGMSASGSSGPSKYSSTGTPALPNSQAGQLPPASPLGGASAGSYPTSPANPLPTNTGISNQPGSNGTLGGNPMGSSPNGSVPLSNSGGYASGAPNSQAYGQNNMPGYGQAGTPGYGQNGSLGQSPSYTSLPASNGNFGTVPRVNNQPPPFNQYATPGGSFGTQTGYPYSQPPPAGQLTTGQGPIYSGSIFPYTGDPLSLPVTNQPYGRSADNRNSVLPTTSPSSANSPNSFANQSTGNSGTNVNGLAVNTRNTDLLHDSHYQAQHARSGVENIVPVMFVLSLVVNFYLGMLIRKLLTRYRSLLGSVRSQTA